MKFRARLPSLALIFALVGVCILALVEKARAQRNATTDPSEVRVLNSIFQKWGLSSETKNWNISGEPCSGVATDSTQFADQNYKALIKCNCSFKNGSTCHITRMKVVQLNARGQIPEELWSLTYLTNLDLSQNSLAGNLSSSIGNLTRLRHLNLCVNGLSGELPEEIGKLTRLISLNFGTNDFSGPLPPDIGNLVNLEQLFFDSSGVSGELPSTFANLQSLQKVWAFSNNLTGKIPDFIGNWTKLIELRLFGNAFDGPIPSTFSKLTSLTDLRISDLSNGGSSLDFIQNMKSLNKLVLRNNNISGSIPSFIGEFQNLSMLDLSFNHLSGQVPDSLFNMSSLSYLFLGNNNLTGALRMQKSQKLHTIDLSYNKLSGSFPSWVSDGNSQLNLIANNFTVSSNSSGLPSGLNCLQQDFPCNRGSDLFHSFAIKCGGPQGTSAKNVVFEGDDEKLGPATYYVTDRWAVSNVGLFADDDNHQYTTSSFRQFTNTLDSELFQTARISPGSLRYFGLGLQNGNYTVILQFAESAFEPNTWQTHGKRLFDIYIQGILKMKDFNIQEKAGGAYAVFQERFNVTVTENYLEIHFFWAGKGTCCVPNPGTYGPSVSAISAVLANNTIPTVSKEPRAKNTGLIVGLVVGIAGFSFLFAFVGFCLARKRRLHTKEEDAFLGLDAKPYTFSYSELKTATGDFDSANKLGEGGFGPVYKGTLEDGREVAVKRLAVASQQGKRQFVSEIATISVIQHRNLVNMYGCCVEGDNRIIVYEYLENRSLDQALFGTGNGGLHLNWPTRYNLCLGIAKGLTYLHEESRPRIVHRDVKASNILLDSSLIPKISDFGLAKLYDDQRTHISTHVAGTIGYLAPEYAMRGRLTEKADVFGFGVVALEVVSGRPNFDSSLEEEKMYLLEWAWHLHENDRVVELVDSEISDFSEEEVKRLVGVALLCTQTSPTSRPSMSRVVAMLSGDIEVSTVTSRPGYLTDWKFKDRTNIMSSNTQTSRPDNRNFTNLSVEILTEGR